MRRIIRTRVWIIYVAILLAPLCTVAFPCPIYGQGYSFSVDRSLVDVRIQRDGSVDIEYFITFTNDSYAHPIDIVDIGLPNKHYDLSSARADVDGYSVHDIRVAEYVETGVEVHLWPYEIGPGETGTLHLEINNPHMIYHDDQDSTYASVEFSPTWFDSEFTHGTTELQVTLYFPEGVGPNETRYHGEQFSTAGILDAPFMTWVKEQASPNRQYTFGVSFPKRYVEVVYTKPMIDLKAISSFIFSWRGLLSIGIGAVALFLLVDRLWLHRRKMDYLPPLVSVEGMGIKRGLTAVEAAILLETPLNKVLTMILFSLVKKGAVRIRSQHPLTLEKVPKGQGAEYLRNYEELFLTAISESGRLDERLLDDVMVRLIMSVNKKMKGFHAKDTIAYYGDIVARAWEQVQAANTPQVLDENLEWIMLDRDFEHRVPQTLREEPMSLPTWWGGYVPVRTVASAGSHPASGGVTPSGAQLANSFVSSMENVSNSIVSNLSSFTARITQVTHPFISYGERAEHAGSQVGSAAVRSVEKGGGARTSGGGGYSCACACACAGCACACAGGGR